MKRYKISEFSKRMGVSLDLIKHYQSSKIIYPEVDEQNGYRYYNVRHGERIIASRRYRKMGFSVNEAKDILYDDDATTIGARLDEKAREIDEQIALLSMKRDHMKILKQEFTNLTEKVGKFEMVTVPSYFYIPHVKNMNFYENESIISTLPDWMENLNFSYKTYRIDIVDETPRFDVEIGLMMEEVFFSSLQIEHIKELKYIPSTTHLIYYLRTEYTMDHTVHTFAAKEMKEAIDQGFCIRTDQFILQHIFDDHVDGQRYINYKVHFFLK